MSVDVATLIQQAADFVFGPWTRFLFLGTALFLTLRLRFVQVVRFKDAFFTMWPRSAGTKGGGVLTPFQSFMAALGATIGTGNIAGVATAVVSGGPGAVFWIWCYGFFATAVKFTEAVLGIKYRRTDQARLSAGPMHYLRDGMKLPWLGWIYALLAGVAALTTTPMTQPNSIAVAFKSEFGIPPYASGIFLAILAWLVIIGGISSIGRAAERLSPLKVGLYLVGGPGGYRHPRQPAARGVRVDLPRSLHADRRRRRRRRHRHVAGDALRARARHLRERGRLRHRGRHVRHRARPTTPCTRG